MTPIPERAAREQIDRDQLYGSAQAGLSVMDATAISLCKENNLPIVIFNLNQRGNIAQVVTGER